GLYLVRLSATLSGDAVRRAFHLGSSPIKDVIEKINHFTINVKDIRSYEVYSLIDDALKDNLKGVKNIRASYFEWHKAGWELDFQGSPQDLVDVLIKGISVPITLNEAKPGEVTVTVSGN
ncbi:MAG: hypothetical protein PHY31_05285, partial [Smithellaceae bacterium]|nr:hypothetical protein [Smithellaceae bacterium]